MLFPDMYFKNIQSVDIEDLNKNDIKGIVLDLDNTLIDFKLTLSDEVINWINFIKASGFKICILSNSNKKNKVKTIADKLGIEYIMSAKKPLKYGFKKVKEKYNDIPDRSIAVIGDQIFTDVLGAKRMNMFAIYVEPIGKQEHWYTKIKRPFERIILKLYKRDKER